MSIVGWGSGVVGWQSAGAIEAQIAALEGEVSKIQVAATVSALPDPSGLADGTLAAVLTAFDNGQAAIYVVRSGAWVLPLEAGMPTISFVIQSGAGAGELPEDVVVGVGADGVLGVGWTLAAAQSFARPTDIAVLPLDPDDLTLGANGAGLWRIAVEVNYDSPAPASGILSQFFLQLDAGAGFADVPQGELARLDQAAPAAVSGISQVGLVLNLALDAGDALRVIVRHDDVNPHTYTVNKFTLTLNQIASAPT